MIIFALVIGAVLIVAAIRNSHGALFAALGQDIPAFVVWAAAIFALGALGFVPGLKPVSRALLALVLVVLILRNYKQIFSGFENLWKNPPAYAPGDNATQHTGTITDTVSSAMSLFGGGPGPITGTTGAF